MKQSKHPDGSKAHAARALARTFAGDPLLELSGDIDGLPPDLSGSFDRYFNADLVRTPARGRAAPRSKSRR